MTERQEHVRRLVESMYSRGKPAQFRGADEVQAWADLHGGEPAVRELLAQRDAAFKAFDRTSTRLVEAWLETEAKGAAEARASVELGLSERATLAAEKSATAAHRAAVWAGWAVALSLASLAISAWPHVWEWFKG